MLDEAKENYKADQLSYERRDVEALGDDPALRERFELAVNFENIDYLPQSKRLVSGAAWY